MKPAMTDDEIDCLSKYLDESRIYLEFGCGGSTFMAAQSPAEKIYSVESDPGWIEKCSSVPKIKSALEAGRLLFHHADVGPTKELGFPDGHAKAKLWPGYYRDVWNNVETLPDLVLVDGRWRVACFLHAMAKCPEGTIFVVHDFWNRLERYGVILDFSEAIERVDTLAVVRHKSRINWREFALAVSQYALDAR